MALLILLLSAAGAIVLYHSFSRYSSLRRNLAEARKSGLPYVTHPWDVHFVLWLATYTIWLPLLKKVFSGVWIE